MNELKTKNGLYIDIFAYRDKNYPFQIFIGGRGQGKTYNALNDAFNYGKLRKPIFMRRTENELNLQAYDSRSLDDGNNTFSKINANEGSKLTLFKKKKDAIGYICNSKEVNGKLMPEGKPLGYALAMTTIHSVRGITLDSDGFIYDEFVPEQIARKINGEGEAFINGYETINRNREFDGLPPMEAWLMSNSEDIYCDLFQTLDIVTVFEDLLKRGISDYYNKSRGLAVHYLPPSELFREKKNDTAIMKLMQGSSYADKALDNKFTKNDFSFVKSIKMNGYVPVCSIEKAYIYRNYNNGNIYVSYSKGQCQSFARNRFDKKPFMRYIGREIEDLLPFGKVIFQSYELKGLIYDIIFNI